MRVHRGVLRRVITAGMTLFALLAPASASGATLTVTMSTDEWSGTTAGSGCSVREAIEAANTDGDFAGCNFGADEDADTIILSPGTTYGRGDGLTGIDDDNEVGDFDVRAEPLTIEVGSGPNAVLTATAGTAGDRVIDVVGTAPITLSITGVDLINGNTTMQGGGLRTGSGTVGHTVNLSNLGVEGNHAALFGGGIEVLRGDLNLTNVTVANNGADGNGAGGLDLDLSAGSASLNSVTVTRNSTAAPTGTGAGGIYGIGGTVSLFNTIVAGNTDTGPTSSAPDCGSNPPAGPTSLGFNLIGDTTNCSYTPATGDITNPTSAGLASVASLSNNTQVYALQPGSPAIDRGAPGEVPSTDQRGVTRPQGPRNDIGAFELEQATPPASPASPAPKVQPAKPRKKCKKKRKRRAGGAELAKKKRCKKKGHKH
jgi:hypothetical protein